jgi:hypothetical protein
MGYSQSKATLDLCVNVLVRPTRIRRASQGPRGRQANAPSVCSPPNIASPARRAALSSKPSSMISTVSSASSFAESLSIDSADHYPARRRLMFEHNHPWLRCFASCWPSGLRASDLADLERRSTALEWSNVFSDDSVSASALSAPSEVASCSPDLVSIRRPILSWPPVSAASDAQQMEMSSTRLFTG